jgi:formate hydrogenlyase transcriptional activator
MCPTSASAPLANAWLAEHGPRELENLLRVIVYHLSLPLLIADDAGNCMDASAGCGQLLKISRRAIVGRRFGEFFALNDEQGAAVPLQALPMQEGALRLSLSDGNQLDVRYTTKEEILPGRSLVILRVTDHPADADKLLSPPWVPDYGLILIDTDQRIVSWHAGAKRLFGFDAGDVEGRHLSFLHPPDEAGRAETELRKAAATGQSVEESWLLCSDGGRFWGNVLTAALRSADGTLQGFALVVRNFTDRHRFDEKLKRSRDRDWPRPEESAVAGVASGEFDELPEMSDTLLDLLGYSRDELLSGQVDWPGLTPPEYVPLDEIAHEEGLRFRACTPFEKELIHKDGTRIPVLVTTALVPRSCTRWIMLVQDLRERHRAESVNYPSLEPVSEFGEIVGVSVALRRVQRLIEVVAPTDANVLILGETGTGKELVARAVHRISPRNKMPFVTLNCAAIPTGLLESELFGYERGAFTGALSQKIGRFEMAHRGTLFLDEVGDIPLDLQPKLLRALQEKAFERLGATKTIPIDVRLVAATNRDLAQMMGDKLFRSDLYYRLKVFPITTPPLRDRPEDIPILARHFVKKYAAKMEREIESIPAETMRALVSWPWPGNVRELENFIERSVILSRGPALRAPLNEIHPEALPTAAESTLEQVERDHIVRVLRECGGVVTKAATRLGLHRTTLNAMMRKLGITRKDF